MAKKAGNKAVDLAVLAADYVKRCKAHAETLHQSQTELQGIEVSYLALFSEAVAQGMRTIPFAYDNGNGGTISGTISFSDSPGTLEWRRDDTDMVSWIQLHLCGTHREECLLRKEPTLNQKVIAAKLKVSPDMFKGSGFYIDTTTQRVAIKTDDGVPVKVYGLLDADEQAKVVSAVGDAAFKNFRKLEV